MATYPGDFNLDGVVNNLDLAIWETSAGIGTTWQAGDTNYDGVVNGLDFDLWKANVGMQPLSGGSGVAGVPEPGTLALLATGLLSLLAHAWRWRKHKA